MPDYLTFNVCQKKWPKEHLFVRFWVFLFIYIVWAEQGVIQFLVSTGGSILLFFNLLVGEYQFCLSNQNVHICTQFFHLEIRKIKRNIRYIDADSLKTVL